MINIIILGVSHLVVPDDFSGVAAVMQWLSYVPKVILGGY